MMPRTPGSDAVDLLTTARGTLVAATRPDDLAAATAYAAVAQAEALARIADAIDAALCVLAGIRDRMPERPDRHAAPCCAPRTATPAEDGLRDYCNARGPEGYVCCREPGHDGPHVALTDADAFCEAWTDDDTIRAAHAAINALCAEWTIGPRVVQS